MHLRSSVRYIYNMQLLYRELLEKSYEHRIRDKRKKAEYIAPTHLSRPSVNGVSGDISYTGDTVPNFSTAGLFDQ